MMVLNTNAVLAIFSAILILAFVYDDFADKIKIPAILLLIGTGIGLKELSRAFDVKVANLEHLLPTFGTVALLLIVLEGSLELRVNESTGNVIKKMAIVSTAGIVCSSLAIATYISITTNSSFRMSLISAIPFSIISSTVAIPTVSNLVRTKKDLIIYESTLSDIIGIVFFNFIISNKVIDIKSFGDLFGKLLLIIVIAFAATFTLIVALKRLKSKARFTLIISILIFVYSVSKSFHLSALVVVLVFGFILNNIDKIKNEWFVNKFKYAKQKIDTKTLHTFTSELAFVAKTIIFILFGFTIKQSELADLKAIFGGLAIVGIYLIVRLLILLIVRTPILPNLFIAPKGLITIILFLSIPKADSITSISSGSIIVAIFISCAIMPIGFSLANKREKNQENIMTENFNEL